MNVRMNDECVMNRVWKAEASGVRLRGRPAREWMDGWSGEESVGSERFICRARKGECM